MDGPQQNDESDLRGLMFSIAYHMTGSVAEAEDLVQEGFFRLERARQSGVVVESPKAYLAAATTRLAIDHMRSARVRRESYVGTWLPEPIVADLHESPEQMAELSDSLSMAFLVLLESLSPAERAVFLLREIFDYSYEDIAQIVDKSEANCRQIFGRARQHLDAHQPRYEASTEQSEALLGSFLAAAPRRRPRPAGGPAGGRRRLLRRRGRQGDRHPRTPLRARPGRHVVLAHLRAGKATGGDLRTGPRQRRAGVVTRDPDGKIVSVLSLEVLDGVIQTVRGVVNPDKLQHLGPVSDFLRVRPDRREPIPSDVPVNRLA